MVKQKLDFRPIISYFWVLDLLNDMQKVISGKALAEKYEKMTLEQKMAVTIMFEQVSSSTLSSTHSPNNETQNSKKRKVTLNTLKGKIIVPDDFDDPIEDIKDYM